MPAEVRLEAVWNYLLHTEDPDMGNYIHVTDLDGSVPSPLSFQKYNQS